MPYSPRSIFCISLLFFLPLALSPKTQAQTSGALSIASQTPPAARIRWQGQPKITRYRLQLALDASFNDIVFDRLVEGLEYTVTELAIGKYFWRIAPAAKETGAYSKPLAVEIGGQSGLTDSGAVLSPPISGGWRTATGDITEPVAARLRPGSSFDLVGVNAYGAVYAISGANGVALWTARYRPDAKRDEPTNSDGAPPFKPLLIGTEGRTVNVVIAFEDGVRALSGETGRELWRAKLPGYALRGVASAGVGEEAASVTIADTSGTITFLKANTGEILSQTKLDSLVVGTPSTFDFNNKRGVLLALNNNMLDVRNSSGARLLAVTLDIAITTGPLIVQGPREPLVMLGTEHGLVAFSAADLKPLWRVVTEDDSAQGSLSAVDLDTDGIQEVVMLTKRGRVVVVNVLTGRIKWFAEGAKDASQPAFADVNGDGIKDVLTAGGSAFAVGFSGRDGTLIWKVDDTPTAAASRAAKSAATSTGPANAPTFLIGRGLVAAQFGTDSDALVVGCDESRTGLRAVGLPKESVKLSRTDALRVVDKQ